jgi:cytochrome c oxidase subunit 2
VRGRRRALCAALAPVALLLAGCGSKQNALAPQSHPARDLASLFWWMMGVAWAGFALVAGMLVLAAVKRRRTGSERLSWLIVIGLGIVMPICVIASLFFVADVFVIRTTQAPAASATRMTIQVIGHQWYWEIVYPRSHVVTANELHIPVRTPINLEVRTADVIHSFWVPQLNRTIDTIPGQTNRILLYADRVGRYRGQCDEFCGLQHAHMAVYVFAEPAARFRAWLANQGKPARKPRSALARQGERIFMSGQCSSCHTVRGTTAHGYLGPDLTHLAGRTSLAALTIPNTPPRLAQWVRYAQKVKPGNQMPDIRLSDARLRAVVAYLEGLK